MLYSANEDKLRLEDDNIKDEILFVPTVLTQIIIQLSTK